MDVQCDYVPGADRIVLPLPYSQDPGFDKALQGIENLQKLNSSDLDDTGSIGGGSELEDEDILIAGGLEDALEVQLQESALSLQCPDSTIKLTISTL